MKLYMLYATGFSSAFGLIVRAKDEDDARQIADAASTAWAWPYREHPWLNPAYSTGVEFEGVGPSVVVAIIPKDDREPPEPPNDE